MIEALIDCTPDKSNMAIVMNTNEILGFRRLSVVDTSVRGNQPFAADGAKLLCNGEIYNHSSLEYVHGLDTYSESDCECIVHLYKKLGLDLTVNILNGVFAFAIMTETGVHFARDRTGVRPLFYGTTNSGNFAMASYARALQDYCTEVYHVPPGWGTYDFATKKLTFSKYNYPVLKFDLSFDDIQKSVRDTLEGAVKDRLMSDRPLGCLLSGGLDSSIIASILCRLMGPDKVRTYSIGMVGSDDLRYARQVAEHLGTDHTEVVFTPEEGLRSIPDVIRDLESYDITTIRASVGMWLLAKHISEHTDDIVLFSGEGSDELFCGYMYFHHAPTFEALEKESRRLVNDLYLYDVLRADRCISSHGLELRVPFLDRRMIDLCFSMDGSVKAPRRNFEKFVLRQAFETYLPRAVTWRRKDGFSDGVSGQEKTWYEHIAEFADTKVSDAEFEAQASEFPSKEAMYYRQIYNSLFPRYQPDYKYWLPKWVDHGGNPSGRVVPGFTTTAE